MISAEWELLLDQAILEGELETGRAPEVLLQQFGDRPVSADIELPAGRGGRSNAWSADEDEFLKSHLGFLSEDEIGQALGRSTTAVKLRRYRSLNLPPACDLPNYYTGRSAARTLGIDDHTFIRILERGKIPYWRLGSRDVYMVRQVSLYRFAVKPLNWVFFWRSVQDLRRITDPHLRRLIARQKERWDDEWWTPGQVAEYHGVDHTDVNRYIHKGVFEKTVKWGNQWILRSEAMKEGVYFVKGSGNWKPEWSEEADCFMLIGYALNVFHRELASMMKLTEKTVAYRLCVIQESGLAQQLIDKYGLEVRIDPATGQVTASRDTYGWMFPRVDWDYRWRR